MPAVIRTVCLILANARLATKWLGVDLAGSKHGHQIGGTKGLFSKVYRTPQR